MDIDLDFQWNWKDEEYKNWKPFCSEAPTIQVVRPKWFYLILTTFYVHIVRTSLFNQVQK